MTKAGGRAPSPPSSPLTLPSPLPHSMPRYAIFGDSLSSEIHLPELRAANGREPRWTLRIARSPCQDECSELLGQTDVVPGVDVRLYRIPNGYRLTYDDTGSFDILRGGHDIVWFKGPSPWIDAARLDIINRVLPIALHAAGIFCLHASAVSIGQAGVAFLAPQHYGKSTLASALLERGARLLSDDVLPVTLAPGPMAWPGVHSVRLLDDAAAAVVGDADRLKAVDAYPMPRRDQQQLPADKPAITKQVLRGLPEHQLMCAPIPLAAVYVLAPAPAERAETVTRTRLSAVNAAMALVQHAKCGVLLAKSEARVLFDRAVAIARQVPVYELTVVRDLARVAAVSEQVARWHS